MSTSGVSQRSALDLRQSRSFCGSILDLRRLGRTTKRVEKQDAGELSCFSSLARSDKSVERAFDNVCI